MGKYLLAHDLGTSGNKATLFSTEGQLIASCTYNYDVYYSNNNWAEQNPNDWWQAVIATTKTLIKNINPKDILAVSFSGQMMGCVCVDKKQEPLRNAIIWADMRATKQTQQIAKQISPQRFYEITGHRLSPSYGGQKLMWIKDNEPHIYAKTYKMLNAKDFIILKLTNQFVTEYSDASSTCLMDLNKLCWSDELLNIMGIDKQKMPKLLKSTDIAGYITNTASELTGLCPNTPVVCGGGDGVCAAVGTGCIKEGIAHSSIGTSSWISITTKKPIFSKNKSTFNWAHIVPGYILPTGTMQSGGGAYSWYINKFCQYEQNLAQKEHKSIYEILEQELTNTSVGSNGLLFLPYLIGERSPWWNTNAKANFIGLKMEHQRKDLLRAIQEGVAMNLNIILNIFKAENIHISELVAVGGGAKSKSWQKIFADVYNTKIILPKLLDEAASMGAAITAGVGIGIFKDFEVASKFISLDKIIEPTPTNVKKYQKLQPIFEKAYLQLQSLFEQLNDFSEKRVLDE
ncbi:xylulokinase [uncultured Megamonas sp.]|jgi:xylulokinase|uniref:xylulokinase n=2 Tax=Megamonas TaxID=158846 RepID=UPI002599BD98|nr:xylulokinase [uncultured Megamonas sp.]